MPIDTTSISEYGHSGVSAPYGNVVDMEAETDLRCIDGISMSSHSAPRPNSSLDMSLHRLHDSAEFGSFGASIRYDDPGGYTEMHRQAAQRLPPPERLSTMLGWRVRTGFEGAAGVGLTATEVVAFSAGCVPRSDPDSPLRGRSLSLGSLRKRFIFTKQRRALGSGPNR